MQQINQKTLRDKVELQGIGLHNGINVNLKIKPLKINSGIVFKRTDLINNNIIWVDGTDYDYTNLINALNVNNNKGTLTTNVLRTLLSDYQSKGGNITAGLVNDLKSKFPDVFK